MNKATTILGSALARWFEANPELGTGERRVNTHGATLRDHLDDLFRQSPEIRSYIVDEHSQIRHHIAVYLNGHGEKNGSVPIPPDSEIYIFQALSGG